LSNLGIFKRLKNKLELKKFNKENNLTMLELCKKNCT